MKYLVTIKLQLFLLLFLIFHGNSYSQLNGTYTIGAGGNYVTITSAINNLVTAGVNGPVIFNIITGNYTENVTIDSVPGASSVNTITFQSQTGNRNDVLWNDPLNVGSALVTINKADHITFKNIAFKNGFSQFSTAAKYVFYFQDDCEGIGIYNNNIISLSDQSYGIYFANASTKNLKIEENLIDAMSAIKLTSSTKSTGTQLIKNQIKRLKGIEISNHDSLYVEQNVINVGIFEYDDALGISLQSCDKYLRIFKNKIIANGYPRHSTSIGVIIQNSNCENSLIANNFIYFAEDVGLSISNSNNINIYYNTIKTISNSFGYDAPNLRLVNSTDCNVKNNIFGGDYTSIAYYNNLSLSSDFNSFFPNSQFPPPAPIIYNGNGFLDIESYQIYSNKDSNSKMNNVTFVSNADLHLSGSSIGNPNLIGTPIAGITDDIDGNPRHPISPFMGADEGVLPKKFIDLGYRLEAMYPNLDSVKVYLASSVSPFQFIDSSTVFSQLDNSKFRAIPSFMKMVPGNSYYIAVKHRNSIETWSANPVMFVSDTISYDFTSSANMAFGNNMIQVGISPVRFAFYSGDVNQDGEIDLTDIITIDNDGSNFATGYLNTDLTGNAMVDLTDLIFSHNNSTNFIEVIKP